MLAAALIRVKAGLRRSGDSRADRLSGGSIGGKELAMDRATGPGAFWTQPLSAQLAAVASSAEGLTSSEAALRLRRFGPNVLKARERLSLARQIIRRFRNPLVLILLGAAAVSAGTGDVPSFLIISTIVAIGVLLDTIQEHRANQAAERLKTSVALTERVIRDGKETTLPADQIVPGDVVLLAAGDLVPADGRILEARDFFVNEALLTGESYPREKSGHPEAAPGDVVAATNAAFMGSSVISGSARLLVVQTGSDTQLGQIADTLRAEPPPAALERGANRFGLLIMRLTVLLALFVLLINVLFHRPLLESFLFAVALAVGLTPELLPMVVSVTLARGALRMADQRVIVKRLAAIHDLGSMDVLCTDKTGTLTEARIELVGPLALGGRDGARVLQFAWLNSHFETGLRSPLDAAILERRPEDTDGWTKLDEVPFGFERRRVSVLIERGGERLLVVKGAPEDVLRLCDRFEPAEGGAPRSLDAAALATARQTFEAQSAEGYRLLGIAWRPMDATRSHVTASDEASLVFAGFAVFMDPPKASAGVAVRALEERGVSIKVLSGDNELVTRHVCAELGIAGATVLTGQEMQALSDEALLARVEDTSLFCRVTPAQKNRIILALMKRGHTVGFLGDGINDAPSLHTADVGISVDSAVDVAKEAADMILLDKDLGVLERGVREGRRTYANIMKYIMMGTSSNFGNMFSMAGASLLLPFLPMLPIQILLNNLLYDVSEIPIPLDDVDEETLASPHRWDMAFIRDFMLTLGPVSSLFDFLTFGLLIWGFQASESLFQTGWFIESLATQVLVIFVIRTRRNPLRSRPNALLAAMSALVVAAAVAIPYTPIGRLFGFVPPPVGFLGALVVMTAAYLLLAEAAKRWFYGRLRRPA
jgi:P-type Mg2+ transporter